METGDNGDNGACARRRAKKVNNQENVSATLLPLSMVEKHVKASQLESVFATQMYHVQVSYIILHLILINCSPA